MQVRPEGVSAQWPVGLTEEVANRGERLRTHAAVLQQLRVLLRYDFPLAHQECAGWAQGLRHAASVPSIASPGPLDQSAMVGMTGKSLVHPNRQHARARSSQAAKKKPGNDPPELPPESRASFSWVSPKIPLALENQV
mmetsp:Transcript_25480/g.53003  ORF Transcript_25480/g.53003 Transcript_25480/m.53003 type:complete len:138 (-) Transcript_25480:8-421(-)